MPDFDGFPVEKQVSEVQFEAATYKLLRSEPEIKASRLLYHRVQIQQTGSKLQRPGNLSGRRLMVFEQAEGVQNMWGEPSPDQKVSSA
jgi:hypothetical protein